MRKTLLLLVLVVLAGYLAGCAMHDFNNLRSLKMGMSKEDVLGSLGEPYKTRSYSLGGRVYEDWGYLTQSSTYPIADQDLTMLTFEDGLLVSWGQNFR